jgi:Zn-dependent protease with chaperone function
MSRARTYPRAPLVRRERSHRRSVVFGFGLLLLLATSPLVGHHLPLGIEERLAGQHHLWALCLLALHVIMAPVHGVFHGLFFVGLAYATWDRYRAWSIQRMALASLDAAVPQRGGDFWEAARVAGVDPQRVRVVEGLANPAFTVGWLGPRIYVARELTAYLSRAELTAVLAHEGAHLARHDPMRLSFLRFLHCALFWLPALRGLAEDVADETEIQADDRAAAARPLALASAIVKLAGWTTRAPAVPQGVGFNQRDLLERRVRRLAGEVVAPRSRVTQRSVVGAGLALSLALISGGVMAHPLAGQTPEHAQHCEQHGAAALFHLFCRGLSEPLGKDQCPHRLGS